MFRAVKLMADLVGPRLYSCCNCRNHVSLHDDIVSKAFQVSHNNIKVDLFDAFAVGIGSSHY